MPGPGPGFQDIQILTSAGQTALDVVDLQAMTVANLEGEVQDLVWRKPFYTPSVTIKGAHIELINTKSEYKTYAIFQGGYITPWGHREQSQYTDDPFAGPWNHWPVHLLPSDGRYAVAHDRITHFALGACDLLPEMGAMVLHGMTNKSIRSLIPLARSWKLPPEIKVVSGASEAEYSKEQKAFLIEATTGDLEVEILASVDHPIVNPAFVISNWGEKASISIHGEMINEEKMKFGYEYDSSGRKRMVVWLRYTGEEKTSFVIAKSQ